MSLNNYPNGPEVLLTFGWVRFTYAALANLSGHGLRVGAGDTGRAGMCQWSRYTNTVLRYPNPFNTPEAFIRTLVSFVREHKVRMLLPAHDETGVIAKHAGEFPPSCALPIPSARLLALANDKSETQALAESLGVPTAPRLRFDSVRTLRERLNSGSSAALVVRLRRGNGARGVFYPSGREDCLDTVARLAEKYRLPDERLPVVQERVPGEGWGVSCLYWEGERIAHFTHRRLREKTQSGGTSTLREHQPNPLLEEMAFKLLDSLHWHGLAMVEFKYDRKSDRGWFIELNPRLWGSLHLAVSAGVEFPYLLYLAATAGPAAARGYHRSCKIKYPWRARWYLGDCLMAAEQFRKGKIGGPLRLLKPGGADTYDDLHWDDPLAFAGELLRYGAGFLKRRGANPAEDGIVG